MLGSLPPRPAGARPLVSPTSPPTPSPLRANAPALALMVLGVLALYCPLGIFDGRQTLLGIDFNNIHEHRIRYAQQALSSSGRLPAWYTRELMGSPFWSNLQSFPIVPTRLLVFWLDPSILYAVAVNLAAVLAAVFTYLYLRTLELGRLAAAAGGWTFAASGYFASRLLAGHLPLLEAFGALPLLLLLVERLARTSPGDPARWRKHLALALAAFCVVGCGHPQVPAYAMGTAILYAIVRLGGRAAARSIGAMVLGVGLSGFVWWPMLRLIARSTRILPLDPPPNDLAFPYWRLKAFFFPWADGWPPQILRQPSIPFANPDPAYFWDTVIYVGWIPVLAALLLGARALFRGRRPAVHWLLLGALGVLAVLLALPFAQSVTSRFRVTLLRSPARMLYLTTFGLACALAVAVDGLLGSGTAKQKGLRIGAAVLLLAVHAFDLGSHGSNFVRLLRRPPSMSPDLARVRQTLGSLRYAFDCELFAPANRAIDDVGFFDSLLLARPYRAFVALSGSPPGTNYQTMDGSRLPVPALEGLCARLVVTFRRRDDLKLIETQELMHAYAVDDPLPRAMFVPDGAVEFLEDAAVLERFRAGRIDFRRGMYLDPAARPADLRPDPAAAVAPANRYERPSSDVILASTSARSAGYVRVMESWDEGWSATLDGRPAELLVAETFAMAVRVPPGPHEVRLEYRTQGAAAGVGITAASTILLALFLLRLRSAG
jgi:hypothetical protein